MLFDKILRESSSYRGPIYRLPPPIYRERVKGLALPDKSVEAADKSGLYKGYLRLTAPFH